MTLFERLLKFNKISLMILASVLFHSCTITTGDIDPTHEILESPVLRFENNQIIWDYVAGGGSYKLQKGGEFVDGGSQTSPYNIDSSDQNGSYRIIAYPLDETTHVRSIEQKGSERLEVVYVEPTKIETPVLALASNILSWATVEYGETYELFKDGVSVLVTNTNTYAIIDASFDGKYTITATPSPIARLLTTSEASVELDVTYIAPAKLPTPVLTYAANVISWPAVANADTYQLFKDGVALANTSTSPHTITSSAENGVYTIVAKSSANPSLFLNSDSSIGIDVNFDASI